MTNKWSIMNGTKYNLKVQILCFNWVLVKPGELDYFDELRANVHLLKISIFNHYKNGSRMKILASQTPTKGIFQRISTNKADTEFNAAYNTNHI